MRSELEVDFGMEREFVFNILTSDISTADCILDLIDNSIDAARKNAAERSPNKIEEESGLLKDYSDYNIELKIGNGGISIKDDCQGMPGDLLQKSAFRVGAHPDQDFSIGIYGVGLIRAFWKLGNKAELHTDTGKEAYKLSFHKKEISDSDTPRVLATSEITTGQRLNYFSISELTPDADLDLSDSGWVKYVKKRIRQVFGICIGKGLTIKVNGEALPEFGPRIRQDIAALADSHTMKTKDGVSVELRTGVHEAYKFPGETGHSSTENGKLTDEFGWYIVCNDRIVLVADTSEKVGWTKVWHSEYNGFIGWAYFISKEPRHLPWDSTKSDISLEKRSQREVAPELDRMASAYRNVNRTFRYVPDGKPDTSKSTSGQGKGSEPPGGSAGKKSKKRQNKKASHSKDMENVFLDCEIKTKNKRVNDLVSEAQELVIFEYPYSSALLLRTLTEATIKDYLNRTKRYDDLLQSHWDGIDSKRQSEDPPREKLTEKQKNQNIPSLSQKIEWMLKNTDVFPASKRKPMERSLGKFKKDLTDLNGITHEDGLLTDSSIVTKFRTNVTPLLEFMLGYEAS